MQKDEHSHGEVRPSTGVPGYQPAQQVTRYEAAATLFQLIEHIEASQAQPKRTKLEVTPGRKSKLTPNPRQAKSYTDVPTSHWASKSLTGLSVRGVALVEGTRFGGEQPITTNELARWAEAVSAWVEGRSAVAMSVGDLVKSGYLPQTSPLIKKADKAITAQETSLLLVKTVVRSLEKISTTSPDSRYAR